MSHTIMSAVDPISRLEMIVRRLMQNAKPQRRRIRLHLRLVRVGRDSRTGAIINHIRPQKPRVRVAIESADGDAVLDRAAPRGHGAAVLLADNRKGFRELPDAHCISAQRFIFFRSSPASFRQSTLSPVIKTRVFVSSRSRCASIDRCTADIWLVVLVNTDGTYPASRARKDTAMN